MDLYNKDRMHELIKQAPPWYRTPGVIKLYFLLISGKFKPFGLGY